MARGPSVLTTSAPRTLAPAEVFISHVQLRDLIICPHETGVVNYVKHCSLVEHNLNVPGSAPKTLAELPFSPNTIAALPLGDSDETLLAAGGQEAEIHLSIQPQSARRQRRQWQFEERIPDASINNSMILTSLNLSPSHDSRVEPRLAISNNDCTVKFFDIPIRSQHPTKLPEVGNVRLNVPVNHSSISPDGTTLLSVGDSSKVYLHRITGGAQLNFTPIATLALPPPEASPLGYPSSNLAASFSTAFSTDGTKYAVASQEGTVTVWDVRSTKPLKVFQTDKSRHPSGHRMVEGDASGWLSDDPWEWTRGNSKAPGWSVRNVKFGSGGINSSGKEIMAFTEHTSLLHVVDARTFETEQIVRVPLPKREHCVPAAPPPVSERLSIFRHRRPSQTQHQPPNRYISPSSIHSSVPAWRALEDTFRIAVTSSPPPPRPVAPSGSWSSNSGREERDLVLIPPLGDREVEHDVQTLLGHHGVHTRYSDGEATYEFGDAGAVHVNRDDIEMEVDELESDCISSHTPSRSSSPGPSSSVHVGVGTRIPPALVPPREGIHARRYPRDELEMIEPCTENDLDIAGTCFDPSGGSVYVASTEGIAEWRISGAEKRWWHDNNWR